MTITRETEFGSLLQDVSLPINFVYIHGEYPCALSTENSCDQRPIMPVNEQNFPIHSGHSGSVVGRIVLART